MAQRGSGAGRLTGAWGVLRFSRSIVSTSKGTPAARSAWVTTSAGAAESAWGSRIVTR